MGLVGLLTSGMGTLFGDFSHAIPTWQNREITSLTPVLYSELVEITGKTRVVPGG